MPTSEELANPPTDGPIRKKLRVGRRQRGAEIGWNRYSPLCAKRTNQQPAIHNQD